MKAYDSYAMKNAYPTIIETANFVTEKDDEAGALMLLKALPQEAINSTLSLSVR
ncbi:MAG: hypothetical protein QM664_04855 [Flavihumibacter sp.]